MGSSCPLSGYRWSHGTHHQPSHNQWIGHRMAAAVMRSMIRKGTGTLSVVG